MLRVTLAQTRPGMILALPVPHPRRADITLLRAGVGMDEQQIKKLREIGVRDVWIQYPRLEFLAEYVDPEVHAAAAKLTSDMAEGFDRMRQVAHATLDYFSFRRSISHLITKLLANPRAGMFIEEAARTDDPTLLHGSNVCFLSVLMGLKLDFYLMHERSRLSASAAREVSSLGVAGMLHDVGMLRLPDVLARWYATQDESDPEWRQHVHLGFEMLSGEVEPAAAAAVLHHHQKFDGTGFPMRHPLQGNEEPVAGSDIHIFARIISAADLFDRLRYPPPQHHGEPQENVPTVRALKRLLGEPYRRWLDPIVLRGLLAVVPPYAPGTIVQLNNGARGVVIGWTPQDPCRPRVRVLEDLDAHRACSVEDVEYDLSRQAGLWVTEAEGQNVEKDNFYPAHRLEFDLGTIAKRMMGSVGTGTRAG